VLSYPPVLQAVSRELLEAFADEAGLPSSKQFANRNDLFNAPTSNGIAGALPAGFPRKKLRSSSVTQGEAS
jgi:hypothetical protein